MRVLDDVTLVCIENRSPEIALWSIAQSRKQIQFKKTVLLTNLPYLKQIRNLPTDIAYIQAPDFKSVADYSMYLLSDYSHLIEGSHALITQWDSFVLRGDAWQENFLKYDYIGPPWPHHPHTPVGNGGFSLRSVKLIKALQDPKIIKHHAEDQCICITNKALLEGSLDIRIAPLSLARQFAFERSMDDHNSSEPSFGFHGFFNFAKVLKPQELDSVIPIIPDQILGGIDTYELIASLIRDGKILSAKRLLKKTNPKGKFWRKHYAIACRLFLTK